mgnify:CR=1 FL=1
MGDSVDNSDSGSHKHHHHKKKKDAKPKLRGERQRASKLELGNFDDPHKQTAIVSERLFGLDHPPTKPAKDHTVWKTTDTLHDNAKQIYDDIVDVFWLVNN